jgi:hypothetical protein
MDKQINIYSLKELINCPTKINNSSFFYISRLKKLIPWYDAFVYYFYIISDKLYVNDFEFTNVFNYFIKNCLTNKEHIKLVKNINFNIINLKNVVFIKFVHSNAGHGFSNIMNTIYYIKSNNLANDETSIVITKDLVDFSYFVTSLVYFFFKKEQIVIVDDNIVVNFTSTYIIPDNSHRTEQAIDYLISHLKLNINNELHIYPNIFCIKTELNICQNKINKCFDNNYVKYIENKGFFYITPEKMDIVTLFTLIYKSQNVIMSWGCCSYLNSIFVNKNSNFLLLCHEGYNVEYTSVRNTFPGGILLSGWLPYVCNKNLILYDLTTELTDNIKQILDIEINDLIK